MSVEDLGTSGIEEVYIPDDELNSDNPDFQKDRITVVEMLSYQTPGEDATQLDYRYSRILKSTDVQPFERTRLKVGENWQKVVPDGCWVPKSGMLVIKSNNPPQRQRQPSSEQLAEELSHDLQVTYVDNLTGGYWRIPVGEHMRGDPSRCEDLRIRCVTGEWKYSVMVLPE